jgi:hypothetical protein
MDERDQLV